MTQSYMRHDRFTYVQSFFCIKRKNEVPENFFEPSTIDRMNMILLAFITGNSSLEPLLEGLFAQIHIDLS